ncbi:hypothetical protein [Aridibaculum aurantiacum]|uniref:hypothetical protein n=1 Tax=Aridibaculum aurantiacum TaxID=2810307 RepID=UPI001A971703|nr:hypothetical protein [Aridibaculum aurantiacum]
MKTWILLMSLFFCLHASAQDKVEKEEKVPMPVWPAMTLENPSGSGMLGTIIPGFSFQSKNRLGNVLDGNAAAYFGLGDPVNFLGAGATINTYGFTHTAGRRINIGHGGLDLHINTFLFKQKVLLDAGITNLVTWGGDEAFRNYVTFQKSLYISANYIHQISSDSYDEPFSYVAITVGGGNGYYQQDKDYLPGEQGKLNPFLSLATPIFHSTNLIAEWTGFDIAIGASSFPFEFPLGFNFEVTDIKYGQPRFILGLLYNFQLKSVDKNTTKRPIGTKLVRPTRTI